MAYKQYGQSKTSSRLASFKRYCEENNIAILPDDLKFIDQKLSLFSPGEYKAILRRYLDEWLLGYADAVDGAIGTQSCGRKRANLWLLGMSSLEDCE